MLLLLSSIRNVFCFKRLVHVYSFGKRLDSDIFVFNNLANFKRYLIGNTNKRKIQEFYLRTNLNVKGART